MKLDTVIPFGRSLNEYQHLFALSEQDIAKSILGVADGPASFNAEMKFLGKKIVSVDPLYTFSAKAIKKQFYTVLDDVIDQVKATPNDWVWRYHVSPEQLRENRIKVFEKFISDYETGKREGRYRVGEMPGLDFPSQKFELALCSHFLFLYSDQLSYEFHRASILEMLRVAAEVRIFPLLTLDLQQSPYLGSIITELKSLNYSVLIRTVDYELQKGGNKMLQIRRVNKIY